ncbi:MAG TPA: hypothetical protein VKE71_03580 [Candidatus Angelobacter sp.]|nr:hypothetical protein [Candidatus Angelobacter sp.]
MTFLHIDMVLAALIGREGATIERFIDAAERGEHQLAILELALYCALCSVQPDDRVNFPRFARLVQFSTIVQSPKPFDHPLDEEIAHWREVVLGPKENSD